MKKLSYTIIVILLVAITACNNGSKEKEIQGKVQLDSINKAESKIIVGVAIIEPQSRIISLYAENGGIIDKINVDINSDIKKGDVIVELNHKIEGSQLEQSGSKLKTQHSLIASSKAKLISLEAKLENAKITFERNKKLFESGGVTKQALDESQYAYESSTGDVAAAKADVEQQQNKYAENLADLDYYKELLNQKYVKAPFDGKILSMDVKVGNFINNTKSIGDFAPSGPLMAITEVDELFANKVNVGMKAYLQTQGLKDTLAYGKVILTSPYLRKKTLFSDGATNMEDRRVREVRVLLDKTTKVLIGSRVECVIILN
jgi:HlyD family secretion protein